MKTFKSWVKSPTLETATGDRISVHGETRIRFTLGHKLTFGIKSKMKMITSKQYQREVCVSRIDKNMTAADLKAILGITAPNIHFVCEERYKNDFSSSCKVSFLIYDADQVYTPSIWSKGAEVPLQKKFTEGS